MSVGPLPTELQEAYDLCDRVARRDKPHLHAAAQYFAFPETRRTFAATYASMRLVDDFVDNIPNRATLSEPARRLAAQTVGKWLQLVRDARAGQSGSGPVWLALSDTFSRFDLPLEPWEDLAEAMQSDLYAPMFRDWDHLRRYMKGASVAPAVVFMHLVMMQPKGPTGRFESAWDHAKVAHATEDLAIFCYWVHILRDVANDLSVGHSGTCVSPASGLGRLRSLRRRSSPNERSRTGVGCLCPPGSIRSTSCARSSRTRARASSGDSHYCSTRERPCPWDFGRDIRGAPENLADHNFDVFAGSLELTEDQRGRILAS